MGREFEVNPEKFAQAILFFSHTANNGLLGKTKLFKLLYYLDFDHFEQFGMPVTGETYLRYAHGPFPESGDRILQELGRRGLIQVDQKQVGEFLQYSYQPLRSFDLSIFSPTEVKTLCDVVTKWLPHNASEMVAATHGEAPWIATEPDQPIPYSLAYYRNKFKEMDQFAEEDAPYVKSIAEVG